MESLHIAHIQAGMSPEHGGPTKSLSNYCEHQARAGHRVGVWTLEGYRNTSPAIRLRAPIENHVYRVSPALQLGPSGALRAALRSAEAPDIYHLHGAWSLAMAYAGREAQRRNRPYLIELMGMYEAWCLRRRWLQKRILRSWFQDGLLQNAACLHVNSQQEGRDLRSQGFARPIAVIPVGVDVEAIATGIEQCPSEGDWPALKGHKYLLYFSRIHPKKGLDLLLECWPHLIASYPEFRLVVAGSGDAAFVRHCRDLADRLGIADSCIWTGHVDEQQKTWLLAHAHCYVLPTHSENFGNTVAEALAHSTPVITTTRTPWSDLVPNQCGWQVDDTAAALTPALEDALSIDESRRQKMGENGLSLVRQRYSLESVTRDMLAVYSWMLARGPIPDCLMQ